MPVRKKMGCLGVRAVLCCILVFWGITPVNAENNDMITIAAVGDIMMGTSYPGDLLSPNDGNGMFDAVRPYFRGKDIVFGNLEGPLTDADEQKKCKDENRNCFAFRTPPHYATYLRDAGFNALNVANNHAADFGNEGLSDTMASIRNVGIHPVGGGNLAVFIRQGKRIAVTGFSYMDTSQYSYALTSIKSARRIVKELKRENDIVIVSFHGGAEGKAAQHVTGEREMFLGEDRGNVMKFSHAVIDAGADLVLGHGPHVLRAVEVYKGKLIAYSLGNFLVIERFNIDGASGISMILKVTIDPDTGDFVDGEIVPVKIVQHGIPVIDKKREAISLVKQLTLEDIAVSQIKIADSGMLCKDEPSRSGMASVKKK